MDKTEVLILEFEKNPVLFDKADKSYKEAVKKKDIWRESERRLDWQVCD